jgi:hypothetical protein
MGSHGQLHPNQLYEKPLQIFLSLAALPKDAPAISAIPGACGLSAPLHEK